MVLIAPDIPFDNQEAFYPYRRSKKDPKIIVPTFQWRECVKRFIVCIKWENKRVEFHDLEWFHANDFGACKQPRLE
jgi:hypothetical protein